MKVRTRIAPSPTGDPHVGTAYVALVNYCFAKQHGGEFVLRIEDTDRNRSTATSENVILEALHWARPRVGRGSGRRRPARTVPAERTSRHLRRARADAARERQRVQVFLYARAARGHAARAARAQRAACVRRTLPLADAGGDRRERRRRSPVRRAPRRAARGQRDDRRSVAWADRVRVERRRHAGAREIGRAGRRTISRTSSTITSWGSRT